MSTENTKPRSKLQGGTVGSVPVPPGTKSRGRLPRPGDPESSVLRLWLLIGAAVTTALAVGVVIGRFVLP